MISPVIASKYLYRSIMGRKLDLKNPQDFNEKLQWLKLYWRDPLITKCTDKYEVRDYVKSCGCEEILNELYGVYDEVSKIDWDNLPSKFALKCTHGCKSNIICDDKQKLDKEQVFNQLSKWMKIRYDRIAAEIHVKNIKPRVICERYIETSDGFLPNDYKIYCFNGKPKLVLVCTERATGYKRAFLDLNWEKLDIAKDGEATAQIPKKPECFEKMLKYSERLAQPFPFVRIDFYDFNGKPILGEMTFTPVGCIARCYTEEGLKWLGDMLELPERRFDQSVS
ncbi:MAG: ATP-grasp fold amidoligase family protein [Actinomycetota bacterium]|nr:ATP-grasp fold amidoligase family protein [Actinomycetota bacterium]